MNFEPLAQKIAEEYKKSDYDGGTYDMSRDKKVKVKLGKYKKLKWTKCPFCHKQWGAGEMPVAVWVGKKRII